MEKQLIIIVFIALLFSCKKENRKDCIKSTGREMTEVRFVNTFHNISVRDNMELEINPDSNKEIKITAGKNLLPLIKTEVINDTLFISNDNTCNWIRSYKHNIFIQISADSLNSIENNSSGNINSLDTIYSKNFTLSGSNMNGNTDIIIKAEKVNFYCYSGSGTTSIKGKTQIANYYNKSIGYLKAQDLTSTETTVNHNGTGDLYVNSTSILRGWINYTGNVYYSGSPKSIDIVTPNKGKLKKID